MAEQKAKARAAWSGSGEQADAAIWFDLAEEHGSTEFLGYDTETAEGVVLALVKGGARADTAQKGDAVTIVVNQTPFYAEAGGQVGDTGTVKTETARPPSPTPRRWRACSCTWPRSPRVRSPGQPAVLEVDHARRGTIRANHSATHLLHEALRRALGDHVAQRGSLNAPDRLRFDFSHGKALTWRNFAG
jgi:alanyl-tRNA synthetase